jgi:hypothetical protein
MDIVSRATRAHAEHNYIYGNPGQVAEQLYAFNRHGVSSVALIDLLPFVLEVEDAMNAVTRTIETSRLLKARMAEETAVSPAGI